MVKSPVDYRFCNQTVTIYHKGGDTYTRTVRIDAFIDYRKTENVDKTGSRESNSFLLIIPGSTIPVCVGDKVVHGEGPECSTREQWASLIPTKVDGLVVINSVDPKYWKDTIVHTEAGG